MAILRFNIIYDRKHATKSGKQGYVEVRFCMNRQQKYFSTGIKVFADEWDYQECKVIRHPDRMELNQRLTAIRAKAYKIVNKAYDDEDGFDFNLLTRMFRGEPAKKIDFPTYCEQRTAARCVSESTRTRYRVFTRFLRSWGKIISFSDLTVAKIRAMDEYLHTRKMGLATIYNYTSLLNFSSTMQ